MSVLRQFKMKQMKLLRGIYRTMFRGHRKAYSADSWWDDAFFTKGVSARQTISPDKDILSSTYHYNSVELLILRHLYNNNRQVAGARVFDLGSGSGHWLDFYRDLGAAHCAGVDVSRKSCEYMTKKYASRDNVMIHQGKLHDILGKAEGRFNIINAVGIMFHLVDDQEWLDTLTQTARILEPGGLLVVGGHFGFLNNINVQFDSADSVNKRLRSARHWKRRLKKLGFGNISIYRNRSYLFIEDTVPENNILIAEKL